jgi:hypothetical protein
MAYFTFAELTALIPEGWLTASLDDESSGDSASFEVVQASAEDAVNAILSVRYAVPVAATPFVKRAALLIAAETCYNRRQQGNIFPYKEELNGKDGQKGGIRYMLEQIAKGEMDLAPSVTPAKASGGYIAEDARTSGRHNSI